MSDPFGVCGLGVVAYVRMTLWLLNCLCVEMWDGMNRGWVEEREKLPTENAAAPVERDCWAAASVGRLRRASLLRDAIVEADLGWY